jgi:hypothetical protein
MCYTIIDYGGVGSLVWAGNHFLKNSEFAVTYLGIMHTSNYIDYLFLKKQ